MQLALDILAVLGFLAVALRLARAGYRVLRHGVDAFLAREAADVRRHRGDLTGMADAGRAARHARRDRRLALLETGALAALLVVPPFLPWTRAIFAAYAALWLAPYGRRPLGQA